jgi:hypothetical protein
VKLTVTEISVIIAPAGIPFTEREFGKAVDAALQTAFIVPEDRVVGPSKPPLAVIKFVPDPAQTFSANGAILIDEGLG